MTSRVTERALTTIGKQTARLTHVPRRLRREWDDALFSFAHNRGVAFEQRFRREESRLRQLLSGPHTAYTAEISSQEMTISLQLACLLYFLCERLAPPTILDLGSGFSSYVFRHYARSNARTVVCSVDDDEWWLARTAEHLRRNGLSDRCLFTWRELAAQPQLKADLVLHDLGSSDTRCRVMPELPRLMRATATAILDDVHKRSIRDAAKTLARREGLHVTDLKSVTADNFGRFAWLIGR